MDAYKACYDKLRSLYINMESHFNAERKAELEKLFDESASKVYLLDDIFMLLCFIINNSDMKDIASSFSIRDFDYGELNRELLDLLYGYYESTRATAADTPENIFPECNELFSECNTTMLMPSDNITSDIPNGAKVVDINVDNCINTIFDVRPIIDSDYIGKNFAGLNRQSGVSQKVLDRFDFMKTYTGDKPSNYIIDSDPTSTKIFQRLDSNTYRELVNGKSPDRDYGLINYNIFITNWENRRIMALRKLYKRPPKSINTSAIIGKIKNNIYGEKHMRIADAIFDAYNSPNLSNDEVLQILISSQTYQEKMPRGVKPVDFAKYFNERDMSSNIL